jgi:molybdenum cofactor cytidylyltransferase
MSVNHSYPSDSLAIIVLAAGRSSRLGQMKQLITVNDKSLVELQLERALKVSSKVYCVLGFNARHVHASIEHLPINTIINSKWSDGMASSIAAGVKALTPDIKAVMIVLVDQWQLTSTDLICHHNYWQGDARAIVVAQTACDLAADVNEKLGPPVLFPRDYFSELTELVGEQGAKPLLKKYQKLLIKVPLAQAFFDIDTPEQLAQMKIN